MTITHSSDSEFDLTRFPFSAYGSWNSISIPKDKDGVWFRHHHRGGGSLFPLHLLKDGEIVEPEITASPSLLTLSHGEARVEICFENATTIRMRGRGIGFQLGERELAYECGENLFALNKPFDRRYQVELLRGHGRLHQLVPTQPVFPKVLEIVPDEDGHWELAVDKFASTWVQAERPAFDDCEAGSRMSFDAFLGAMPSVRNQDAATHRLATYVNWATTVEPCGLVKRPSLLMSKFTMSNIWSWDHAFNALALAAGHPQLALDQMLCMVDHQDEFGCYPDSFNDLIVTYNFAKPPVHGWIFGEMLERLPARPDVKVIETMYASLGAQADWWMTHRVLTHANTQGPKDPNTQGNPKSDARRSEGAQIDGSGGGGGAHLPYYLHGNDSGWDNSTMFKLGVPLEAPDLSALLVLQMDVLAELAETLGDADEAVTWRRRADELFERMMEALWCGDHFVARHGVSGDTLRPQSLVPHLAIILGERLPQNVRDALKQGIEAHLTEWGLATEQVESPLYNADGYWTGPIWAPATFIAVTGLARSGFTETADEVARRFCRMADQSGFPENYNAVTGEALRCPAYTWTSSVYTLLAERLAK